MAGGSGRLSRSLEVIGHGFVGRPVPRFPVEDEE
jgi:hypothetical protein